MKPEYDFSQGERGKFFRPHAELHLPILPERRRTGLSGRTRNAERHSAQRDGEYAAETGNPDYRIDQVRQLWHTVSPAPGRWRCGAIAVLGGRA